MAVVPSLFLHALYLDLPIADFHSTLLAETLLVKSGSWDWLEFAVSISYKFARHSLHSPFRESSLTALKFLQLPQILYIPHARPSILAIPSMLCFHLKATPFHSFSPNSIQQNPQCSTCVSCFSPSRQPSQPPSVSSNTAPGRSFPLPKNRVWVDCISLILYSVSQRLACYLCFYS